MRKVSVALLGFALLMANACIEDPATPDLVAPTAMSPQRVEAGDTLQIAGRGFPEGVPVRLSFHGDLFRAGKPPLKNVEIVVRTQDTSKNTITLAVNDEVERAFCGAGDSAVHATFRGDVTAAFGARSTSMAPVTGTLRNVRLEVQPRLGSYQVERERHRVASEALVFLGLTLDDSSASDCCSVAAVQGRSMVAGLRPGDRLLDFDGVSVISASDLVPSGRNRTARLSVRRESSQVPIVRNIEVQGFRWTVPSELAPALACALAMLGFILAWVSPLRSLLAQMAEPLASRLEEQFGRGASLNSSRRRFASAMRSYAMEAPLPESAAVKVAALGSVISVGSLCTVLTMREELLSAELDLPLWWLGTSIAFALSAFVLSFTHWRRGFVRSLVCGLGAMAHQLPLLALIVSIAVVTRTTRISDVVRFQKGWPQEWLLFHDPALFVASILAVVVLIPEILPSALHGSGPASNKPKFISNNAGMISFVVNRLHLWVQALLIAVVVLGGWSIPGLGYVPATSITLRLLAVIGLLAKVGVVVGIVSIVRWALGPTCQHHTIRWVLRWAVPVSLGSAILSALWCQCIRYFAIVWADSVTHFVIMGLFFAVTTLLVFQTRSRLRAGTAPALASPWI